MNDTHYTGWTIPKAIRKSLIGRFAPRYENVVVHHCTAEFGVPEDHPLPQGSRFEIVGWADDEIGVQAAILSIDGNIRRSDGSTFHITWSLAEGRKAVESNHVIREHGWEPCPPFEVSEMRPFITKRLVRA